MLKQGQLARLIFSRLKPFGLLIISKTEMVPL